MEADVRCTTGKLFVGVKMEGASSMVFDVLLTVILLLGPVLFAATLLCTRQAHFPRRQHPYAQTRLADESPRPLEPTALSSAIEPLPAVVTAISSKDSAMEAPLMVEGLGQPQTVIQGSVRTLNLTINNNAPPQSDQAALISMVEGLQALRADINKIGRQVSREIRSRRKTAQGPPFHNCQQNPGPGPWASSNFDHYEYGSGSGDDSGWGTERRWPLPQEDENDEHAGEGETFETQTAIQDRTDCNVEAIDLWRSGTEEGAAVDKENQGNQSDVAPASGSSRSSRKSQQQQPRSPISTPTPRSVQATPSNTLDLTSSPVLSNMLSGANSGGPSTLDDVALNSELSSKTWEYEEVERQSTRHGHEPSRLEPKAQATSPSRLEPDGEKTPPCSSPTIGKARAPKYIVKARALWSRASSTLEK